jgi:hypothetical protein
MRRIVATAAAFTARAALWAAKAAVNVAYGPTMQSTVAQGATELSNALFTGHAYSPYTADNAAHRAQFQAKDNAKDLTR